MTLQKAYEVSQIIDKITELNQISELNIDTYEFGLIKGFGLLPSEKKFLVEKLRIFTKETLEQRRKELEQQLDSM